MSFNDYDLFVIEEIAKHIVEPNPVHKLLALAGKPIDKVLEIAEKSKFPVVKKVNEVVTTEVSKALETTIKTANHLCSESSVIKEFNKRNVDVTSIDEVRFLGLEQMDKVADSYDVSNAVLIGLEGVLMGLTASFVEMTPVGVIAVPPIVAADVASSMVLLSRHACQIATSYGYSSEKYINIPHILAAMAPTSNTSDEGYFATKALVIDAIRDASASVAGKTVGSQTPHLIQLINYVAERLGVSIGEKELGLLVPIAGAVLNGGINIAFQQSGHTISKDYFRQLILEERYGSDIVRTEIENKVLKLKSNLSK